MSVTVKINRFHLPKAKANLIGRIEFRGKQILSDIKEFFTFVWV